MLSIKIVARPYRYLLFIHLLALALLAGCSSWAGNPGDDDDDEPAEGNPNPPTGGGGTSLNVALEPGNAMIQSFSIKGGTPFSAALAFGAALTGNDVEQSGPLEFSIIGADGKEVAYDRSGLASPAMEFVPDSDGDYLIAVKNNSDKTISGLTNNMSGVDAAGALINATARTGGYADIALKAVIVIARTCKQYVNGGASTQSFNAPAGEYFVQPFVFLGQVGADKRVTPITSATISVIQGERKLQLKALPEFDLAVYREISGMTKAQHEVYTRKFYQGYFGAAGEMYTTDTFLFGGDCSKSTTFPIGEDAGKSELTLSVEDATLAVPLAASWPVRPTISPSFSMYTSADVKLQDYTQCTYDRTTGEPVTYNGDAADCKEFSRQNAPYVTLDYLLPSAANPGVVSADSDPTRIAFYGHAHQKEWYKTLIENSEGLLNGSVTDLALSGCFATGGMTSVPLSTDKTYMPLAEFNVSTGDVINLARRSGSYTALPDLFQGNVDQSGSFEYTTCVPKGAASCEGYKTVTVTVGNCQVKADSGITTLSISDSFLYPGYFEMSGIITD